MRGAGKAGIARVLTALETQANDPGLVALLDAAFAAEGGASLGLTGPPGVGKSCLTQALIKAYRAQGQTVAIVAVDPSSSRTGGALLGDRTRIDTDPEDDGVFMRSMAARGALGGLAEVSFPAIVLLRALYDIVIVETVGVGQSEIEVAARTDGVIFCAQPGSGDALQYMKAGVMETPQVILVTKGDMGVLAERTAADLKGALSLDGRGDAVSVQTVSAVTGAGIAGAMDLIDTRIVAPANSQSGWQNRLAQGESWLTSRLSAEFGRAGLSMVRNQILQTETPFSRDRALQLRLKRALEAGWSGENPG
nr:ATP/GTP-binding protein [Rubricella aquisinus]